jgi:hypothetical protein
MRDMTNLAQILTQLGPLDSLDLSNPLVRKQKVSVPAAAAMNDVSTSSFKRNHAHLIKQVGKRREAVELGDAIDLPPKPSS